jgi:hypothetical protein
MALPVPQYEACHRIDVFDFNTRRTSPGCMGTGGAQPDQISTQAVDLSLKAPLTDLLQGRFVEWDDRDKRTRLLASLAQRRLLDLPDG